MRSLAIAFVITLAACERENAPEPTTPATVPTSNEPAIGNPPTPAPLAEWGGSWATDFGTLTITQQGNQVTGSYVYNNSGAPIQGQMSGQVIGNHLDFAWEEGPGGAGSGHGSFVMSADGSKFEGTWGQGESRTSGGNWNGKRM